MTTITLDRAAFIKPIAHRGWHEVGKGVIENTGPAFDAGLQQGFGIECDLQPASDGTPMVFHDETLERLMEARGRLDGKSPKELAQLAYRGTAAKMLTFTELLELAAGRGPLLVEIKSEWKPLPEAFLAKIAKLAKAYRGPLGLMSFDPGVMARMAALAPRVPRGIVSGVYAGKGWNVETLGAARAERLTHLLESRAAAPSFYAYQVSALPTPVTRFVREVDGLPLFTWTVRTAADWKQAKAHADAPIFEGAMKWDGKGKQ